MPQFLATYQDTPYVQTTPATMIVEADDRAEAFITVCAALNQKGQSVGGLHEMDLMRPPEQYYGLGFTADEAHRIREQFPNYPTGGRTHIRHLTPYSPQVKGKVVQG